MLERFIGKRVKIDNTPISGVVTDVREEFIMDMEFANGVKEIMPSFIEIDGYIQAHPSRVSIVERAKI